MQREPEPLRDVVPEAARTAGPEFLERGGLRNGLMAVDAICWEASEAQPASSGSTANTMSLRRMGQLAVNRAST